MGLDGIARAVEHDVTQASLLEALGGAGSVDVVTMSYSFSMIPDQAATIRNIQRLLKKDGHLAMADFFLQGNYDDDLSALFSRTRAAESMFHKQWFAMNHVYLLENHQLQGFQGDFETVWDSRFRGAVPFLPFLVPYHGVYIMKKK
jgi:ubiquinone/menaquinone biosynthesis C-methylase UbiE